MMPVLITTQPWMPGTAVQLTTRGKALCKLARFLSGISRMKTRTRAVTIFANYNALQRRWAQPEMTWQLFMAAQYYRLTFKVEGKRITLR